MAFLRARDDRNCAKARGCAPVVQAKPSISARLAPAVHGMVCCPDRHTYDVRFVTHLAKGGNSMTLLPRLAGLVLVLGLAGTAAAQLPFPLPGEPTPDMSKRPQCTKDYLKSVDQQITMLDKFRSAGPEAVGQLCSLIELGSDW